MRKLIPIALILMVTTLVLSSCFALAEPEAASGTAVAPTLAAPTAEAAALQPLPSPMALDPDSVEDAYPVDAAPTPEVPATAVATENYPADEAASPPLPGTPLVFVVDPSRSEARFIINEVLRGTPTTVVGTTSNLAGELALDLADPTTAQVGTIVINARDLKTDNNFRNNAIANEILLTNQFEFITFTPTDVSGLPETATSGEAYELQISGDLTITDQTRPVTFTATITPLNANELSGLARAQIAYADFGLTIPFAQSVESVEDTVILELEFVAAAP